MAEHPVPHPDVAGYLFGVLDPDRTKAFEAHLAGCAACRAEVADLRGLPALLTATASVGPPGDLQERTVARIRADRSATPAADPDGH
jgi:anti-sigma factor RsiW